MLRPAGLCEPAPPSRAKASNGDDAGVLRLDHSVGRVLVDALTLLVRVTHDLLADARMHVAVGGRRSEIVAQAMEPETGGAAAPLVGTRDCLVEPARRQALAAGRWKERSTVGHLLRPRAADGGSVAPKVGADRGHSLPAEGRPAFAIPLAVTYQSPSVPEDRCPSHSYG